MEDRIERLEGEVSFLAQMLGIVFYKGATTRSDIARLAEIGSRQPRPEADPEVVEPEPPHDDLSRPARLA